MLENKFTLQEDSIEKLFCEPFSKLAVRQMTKDEQEIMVKVMLAENEGKGDELLNIPKEEIPTSVGFIRKSLKGRFTFEMNDAAQLMLAQIVKSFGEGIMYLTYLQYQAKKLNKRKLTVNDLATIFPMGFPTDGELHKIWDSQKVKRSDGNINGSDNLLDYQTALKSIHFDEIKEEE
jgi:hypothetical protein